MKAHLMYKDRDFESNFKLSLNDQLVIRDLGLDVLFEAMSKGDNFVLEVAKKTMFSSLNNPQEILYRQNILKDCIKNPAVIRDIYRIVTEAIEKKREWYFWGISSVHMSSVLSSSVNLLLMFLEMMKKLRRIADENIDKFESKGFNSFFKMLREELNDNYLSTLETHLNELKFRDGMLVSAELGNYNQGINYVLRRQENKRRNWLKWRLAPSLYIHPRDENGGIDLSKRKDRAINNVANALAQSTEHVVSFFTMLKTEIAFYIGCLDLYEKLSDKGEPTCFPVPVDLPERSHSFMGLYDVSLSLLFRERVVGNDINADNKDLVIITGANQGGKSTFLRSIGQAQLMMQCGMFVGAESFSANIANGIFTHFKKEEDVTMESGKLEEELGRMSEIADLIKPNSIILFNESFSATNEREGSEIARQVVRALLEERIKVFFVTHFYDLAYSFYAQERDNYIFLRAERNEDGTRTFKVIEGKPLPTSFGEDLYYEIFKASQ